MGIGGMTTLMLSGKLNFSCGFCLSKTHKAVVVIGNSALFCLNHFGKLALHEHSIRFLCRKKWFRPDRRQNQSPLISREGRERKENENKFPRSTADCKWIHCNMKGSTWVWARISFHRRFYLFSRRLLANNAWFRFFFFFFVCSVSFWPLFLAHWIRIASAEINWNLLTVARQLFLLRYYCVVELCRCCCWLTADYTTTL